ncbi:hypothetical protein DPEC_G00037160 [Dallia pectoralis]|uniref:Uncharacterized protein n=1 Tax=Dallia pectoralis TaxID=75939 RepID=A0ACC2HEP4_DALPE|nr:hypothetical protein DPEC_G00037160 [Dallia pectoralis]
MDAGGCLETVATDPLPVNNCARAMRSLVKYDSVLMPYSQSRAMACYVLHPASSVVVCDPIQRLEVWATCPFSCWPAWLWRWRILITVILVTESLLVPWLSIMHCWALKPTSSPCGYSSASSDLLILLPLCVKGPMGKTLKSPSVLLMALDFVHWSCRLCPRFSISVSEALADVWRCRSSYMTNSARRRSSRVLSSPE